jgi:shikimate kinase
MNKPPNIVLTGFMGTGKTTVGWQVADIVRWKFIDADEEIEARLGMTIPQIFETQGEDGFRRYESIVCRSLAARQRLVIATGGGMLVNPVNLSVMQSTGFVICLNADPKIIQARLANGESRPLAPDWRALYEQRQAAYAAIPYQIDTSNRTPDEIAIEVVQLWQRQSP